MDLSACQPKDNRRRTDGRTDGQRHSIIRPTFVGRIKMSKRFAEFNDLEMKEKRKKTVPKSTILCNNRAKNLLDAYVMEKQLPPIDYGVITQTQLDQVLTKFYLEARTGSGDCHKA